MGIKKLKGKKRSSFVLEFALTVLKVNNLKIHKLIKMHKNLRKYVIKNLRESPNNQRQI